MTISFRPHHFLCALCFKGKGYSPSFVANFADIMAKLKSPEGGKEEIEVVAQTDSICQPCPHNTGTRCQTEDKIAVLDKGHAEVLHIKTDDVLTWSEAKQRIAQHMTLDHFHKICATCSWKKFGICEEVIEDFLVDKPYK